MRRATQPAAVAARLNQLLDALAPWLAGLGGPDPTDAELASAWARLQERRGDEAGSLPLAEARAVMAALTLAELSPGTPPPIPRESLAAAVRSTLGELARRHPGKLVEVRVPPWGAVQVGIAGVDSVHRRGTPPNVVECAPATWLRLASGRLSWAEAVSAGDVLASGSHAQLDDLLPV